jgi:hypothetical protein
MRAVSSSNSAEAGRKASAASPAQARIAARTDGIEFELDRFVDFDRFIDRTFL